MAQNSLSGGLAAGRSLAELAREAGAAVRDAPPVERWNPDFCGDIDMRIAADGTWHYQGSPIRRPALVKLFASVLRKDEDGRTYLVTPVEKVGIAVDDAPFLAVEMKAKGEDRARALGFRTNVDDWVVAGPDHPIRFATEADGGLKPYLRVRGRLDALVTRALVFDLVDMLEEGAGGQLGLWSGGAFFAVDTGEARP